MKTMLIMLLVSLCVIGWRSPDIMQAIGLAGAAQDPATLPLQGLAGTQIKNVTVDSLPVQPAAGHKPMSVLEFAELATSDPQAYQKLINSMKVDEERSEVDKLMNFFARGKFE
ncbi:hypothetical protein [Noviherbaspirillum saxi]|uniref:Uncharacterized protein n=1 Tax=Noviherbaspirillum saxi TaxID=2320863 RepID=A0A3A3FPG1_9BURK|nr:hypothetical protein [Noviherbaspirillum saxi]RJF97350.1 hypothetical protein D3871_01485 [Noviherbaspirillum saxi]